MRMRLEQTKVGQRGDVSHHGESGRRGGSRMGARAALVALALAMLVGLVALPSTASALEPADPNPLRRAEKLRAQAISARGDLVVIGWREGGRPDRLFLSLSRDGGASFQRGSGRLRTFSQAGIPGRGLAVTVCGRRQVRSLWSVTALAARSDRDARQGDSDVLLTRRRVSQPMRDASQLFLTSPRAKRQVRDADIACVGDHHLAIAWLERKDGRPRARLAIRRLGRSGDSEPVRTYNLGRARFRDGIAVAATPDAVHVAWTRGDRGHLRYERFRVASRRDSRFRRGLARGLAWRDVERPVMAARGRKVVIAYSDGGALRLRTSTDRGRAFSAPQGLAAGSQRQPSRARSIALSGNRIVVEAIDRSSGGRIPTRLDSPDLGGSWNRVALPDGLRLGDLEKVDFRTSRLKELLHRDGPRVDVLRARYEQP